MRPLRQGSRRPSKRRGAVLVWFIFVIPIMLMLLLALTDYAGASMAKIELKNSVDAAALTAIKSWGPRGAAAASTDANTIIASNAQTSGILSRTLATSSSAEDADVTSTTITFGVVQTRGGMHVFTPLRANTAPAAAVNVCVAVQRTVVVPSLGGNWLGISFGPYIVTAESFARLSPQGRMPQLVYVDTIATEPKP